MANERGRDDYEDIEYADYEVVDDDEAPVEDDGRGGERPPLPPRRRRKRGPEPCRLCGYEGRPRVSRQMSAAGWLVFVALLVTCIPLCWLPFVIDACKEDVYRCDDCGALLGRRPL